MSHWLENTLQHLQLGEALISGGVESLWHGWQGPAGVIGEICTGAERWQAAIRGMSTPVNLAEILRARKFA
jgi:hypothetical protein